MGCCSTRVNLNRHENRFVQIKILIEEISEFLFNSNYQINPLLETVNSFINHLNSLISQTLETLIKPLNTEDLEKYKSITEEKLNSFDKSLLDLYDFLKNPDKNLTDEASVIGLKAKMVEIQYSLRELLKKAVTIIFPSENMNINENSKKKAIKGIFKNNFNDILAQFEIMCKNVDETLKSLNMSFLKEFNSIISAYYWLNSFCYEGNVCKFKKYSSWKNFKRSFQKFIEETLQIKLSEAECLIIKNELDVFHNNSVHYKAWDNFYCKKWSHYKIRMVLLNEIKKNDSFEVIENYSGLMLFLNEMNSEESKNNIEMKISEKGFEITGMAKVLYEYENYLNHEEIKIGTNENDDIKLKCQNFFNETICKLYIGMMEKNKCFFIINNNNKLLFTFQLHEKPYILSKDFGVILEDKYILNIGNNNILKKIVNSNEYHYIDTSTSLEYSNSLIVKIECEELNIKIFDKNRKKIKEFNLKPVDEIYNIYENGKDLIIQTPKSSEYDMRIYCEIKYIPAKKWWILQKSEKSFTDHIQILPFAFSDYELSFKKPDEKVFYRGQIINNDSVLVLGGLNFLVIMR